MRKISEIFDVKYGNQLDFSKMVLSNDEDAVDFISRNSNNNGFVGRVKRINGIKPNASGTITVTMGGTYLLSSFVQPHEFYTAQNIKVLTPKTEMSLELKLLYCSVIECNRFKYHSHSREANSTFDDIMVPTVEELPSWHNSIKMNYPTNESVISNAFCLNINSWKPFFYHEIFTIQKGFYNKKPESHTGTEYPFIGAIDNNNGVSELYSINDIQEASKTGDGKNEPLETKLFEGNCITVSNNGSVGYAFYQPKKFTCTHDVNPLYINPKWGIKMNPYIAMFLCTIIELEQYRWAYGRKWRPKRMPKSIIKLPVDSNGNPDWQFMEDYIKSLPYSKNL